jgi:hypothetical protein
VWFAARTNPDGEQHAGLSVFIVKLSSPGITILPGMALYGRTFSTVFYDNVRVPATAVVGGLNNGWKVITGALIEELVMLASMHQAIIRRAFGILTNHIRTTKVDGKPLHKNSVICDRIGAIAAEIEVAKQFLVRNTKLADERRLTRYEAAVSKVFLSELQERLGQAALDILGTNGLLSDEALGAPIGEMEQVLRHSIMPIIGGGTNEIHRTQIAASGRAQRKPRNLLPSKPLPELPALRNGSVPEWLGKQFLAAAGMPVPEGALARCEDEALVVANRIGYPVALKAQAAALSHKTEAGGVVLGVADKAGVRDAWRLIC